jgi:FixJ family two-component response regulator
MGKERVGPRVHVVEVDQGVRDSLAYLLASYGFDVCAHAGVEPFLACLDAGVSGCLVLSPRTGDAARLGADASFRRARFGVVLLIEPYPDLDSTTVVPRPVAVLSKPVRPETLVARVRQALATADR